MEFKDSGILTGELSSFLVKVFLGSMTLLSSVPEVLYLLISLPSLKSLYKFWHFFAALSKWGHIPESSLENIN